MATEFFLKKNFYKKKTKKKPRKKKQVVHVFNADKVFGLVIHFFFKKKKT